jgi:hypothetical protein
MSIWDSKEAFFAMKDNETVLNQMKILKGNATETSYLKVTPMNGERDDISQMMSSFQKHILHQKCQLLCLVLWFAKEYMNKRTWQSCYNMAIKVGHRMGLEQKIGKTNAVVHSIQGQGTIFLTKGGKEKFASIFGPKSRCRHCNKKYALSNLGQLSCEMVS